jgi:hypothetical protein
MPMTTSDERKTRPFAPDEQPHISNSSPAAAQSITQLILTISDHEVLLFPRAHLPLVGIGVGLRT